MGPQLADVEVSIVSLEGGSQLTRCLAALPAACAGLAWRLTLVDNSPLGLDLTPCLAGLPATVLRSEGRRGFGANHNLVLAGLVCERRARYVLVLNDDTEPGPRSVTALVRHADRHSRTGALAPVIKNSRGTNEPPIIAWPTLSNQALGSIFPGFAPGPAPAERGRLNGACMLIRIAALAQVGLFDPRYFLFFEEADLCRRLRAAGWQIGHCPGASIVHHEGQTTRRMGSGIELEQQGIRSRYIYFRKHHGRLAARVLNGLVRSGLLARTIKAAVKAVAGREPTGSSTAGVLWALTRYPPTRPSPFELEALSEPLQRSGPLSVEITCARGRSRAPHRRSGQ